MNISINTYPLESGHKNRGIGVYTKELISALQKYESSYSYTYFTRTQDIPKKTDIVHYPFFDPFFLTVPLVKSKPTIITVHDLIPLVFPEHFPKGIRGELKWQIQRLSLKNTNRIITDSKTSQLDIAKIIPYDISNIDVVPLAASDIFNPYKNEMLFKDIQKKYNIPDNYILYYGDINWNKNVPGLLKAWELVRKEKSFRDIALVCIGKAFPIGYVPDNELVQIIIHSKACVMPSLYEGFGLPLLEAMACGAVTIASNTSSLADIPGPTIRINPESSESIVNGIKTALRLSENEKELFSKENMNQASKYSWEQVAHQTVLSYEKALE